MLITAFELCAGTEAAAQSPVTGSSESESTHAVVSARSETTVQLFQRALLPGPNGALIEVSTLVPVYEYWSLSAVNVTTPWSPDTATFEASGWFNATPGQRESEPLLDGDVQALWIRQTYRRVHAKLGRQAIFGGAARYVRFDGVELGVASDPTARTELGLDAYAGFTVLPRWDNRPGYYHLGTLAESLVRDPTGLPEADRSGHRLFGTRARWAYKKQLRTALSFHEQYEAGELSRRNLGLDLHWEPLQEVATNVDLTWDVDSRQVIDARGWAEWEASQQWLLTAEALHTEPRLFLPKQSVLSVFDTGAFEELGLEVTHTPVRSLSITPRGYIQFFPDELVGARGEVQLWADLERSRRTRLGINYSRVLVPGAGYHALRHSMRRRLTRTLSAVGDVFFYWYDRAIQEQHSSSVFGANLLWHPSPALELMGGGSLARTPYAQADAQLLVRLSYRPTLTRESL